MKQASQTAKDLQNGFCSGGGCGAWLAPPTLVHPCVLSHVWLFATPWTIARQAPLSMEFFRQEYCSGLPCPLPGHLPSPGINPTSLTSPALASRFFTTSTTWKANVFLKGKSNFRNTFGPKATDKWLRICSTQFIYKETGSKRIKNLHEVTQLKKQ